MAVRSNLFDVDVPALERLLRDANERLVARRDDLVAEMARVPQVFESGEEIERVRAFAAQRGKLLTECDRQRKADKNTFLKAGKTVDGFFAAVSEPAEEALRELERRMDQAAQSVRHATAEIDPTPVILAADQPVIRSGGEPSPGAPVPEEVLVWEVEAIHRPTLDLEALRDLFTERELGTVIQRHLRKAGPNALRGVTYRRKVRLH